MVVVVKIPGIGGAFRILSEFRELSLCGPFGPCFMSNNHFHYSLINESYYDMTQCVTVSFL